MKFLLNIRKSEKLLITVNDFTCLEQCHVNSLVHSQNKQKQFKLLDTLNMINAAGLNQEEDPK